jgi:hypothetical protein
VLSTSVLVLFAIMAYLDIIRLETNSVSVSNVALNCGKTVLFSKDDD